MSGWVRYLFMRESVSPEVICADHSTIVFLSAFQVRFRKVLGLPDPEEKKFLNENKANQVPVYQTKNLLRKQRYTTNFSFTNNMYIRSESRIVFNQSGSKDDTVAVIF